MQVVLRLVVGAALTASKPLAIALMAMPALFIAQRAGFGGGDVSASDVALAAAFGTAVLLFSSFFVVLALNGLQRGNQKQFVGWLAATVLCGLFFVGMQVYEFTHFVHEKHLGFTTNLFASSFYTLTGFHGVHVSVGIVILLSVVGMIARGRTPDDKSELVEIVGLYWHFVDIVWILIFTLVYLIPA